MSKEYFYYVCIEYFLDKIKVQKFTETYIMLLNFGVTICNMHLTL